MFKILHNSSHIELLFYMKNTAQHGIQIWRKHIFYLTFFTFLQYFVIFNYIFTIFATIFQKETAIVVMRQE